MKIVGIICEYNPFHLGHGRQLSWVRQRLEPEDAIVCLMSGNFAQRGAPAIFDKSLRARAALASGADLVLELPVGACLSSAEGFAAGGVEILAGAGATALCFGAESPAEDLRETARLLLRRDFSEYLRWNLKDGLSFPAARAQALARMGGKPECLRRPNDILAVEYCKAILSRGLSMEPWILRRPGDYHAEALDPENPSATALRRAILAGEPWEGYVPETAAELFRGAAVHSLAAGERAVLARLRTMAEAEFEAVPYGGEGLWRRFMTACRKENTLEAILEATKSKRYVRTRLDRMAMCAFLGLRQEDLTGAAPYVRVLAFNDRGRQVLAGARENLPFVNVGTRQEEAYAELERRCGDLYGLFAAEVPEAPGRVLRERVFYAPSGNF